MRGLAPIVLLAMTAACGRIDFDARGDAAEMDAASLDAPLLDAPLLDAPLLDAPGSDASADGGRAGYCNDLTGATEAECMAAASGFVGSPELFYTCALACRLGRCFVLDPPDCPTCACDGYVKSSQICDESGSCGPPLSGSGCLGSGYYAMPPISCPSGTVEQEGACILDYLLRAGFCD